MLLRQGVHKALTGDPPAGHLELPRRRRYSVDAVRKLVIVPVVVGALAALAGCSANALPKSAGTLTGVASPCAGPMAVNQSHIEVYRSGRLISTSTVPAESTYRIVLPAGHYAVSNAGPEVGIHAVVVRAGKTTHLDLPDWCS